MILKKLTTIENLQCNYHACNTIDFLNKFHTPDHILLDI